MSPSAWEMWGLDWGAKDGAYSSQWRSTVRKKRASIKCFAVFSPTRISTLATSMVKATFRSPLTLSLSSFPWPGHYLSWPVQGASFLPFFNVCRRLHSQEAFLCHPLTAFTGYSFPLLSRCPDSLWCLYKASWAEKRPELIPALYVVQQKYSDVQCNWKSRAWVRTIVPVDRAPCHRHCDQEPRSDIGDTAA